MPGRIVSAATIGVFLEEPRRNVNIATDRGELLMQQPNHCVIFPPTHPVMNVTVLLPIVGRNMSR